MIIVGNLSSPLLTLQTQFLANEAVAECLPVILRISHMVSIVVARGTTELRSVLAFAQQLKLFCEAVDIHHHLLAESCRAGWLTVSLGEHRYLGPFVGIFLKLGNEFLNLGNIYLLNSIFQRQRHTGVVDILACQSEVDEFLPLFHIVHAGNTFFDEVFHSLHVVICD